MTSATWDSAHSEPVVIETVSLTESPESMSAGTVQAPKESSPESTPSRDVMEVTSFSVVSVTA